MFIQFIYHAVQSILKFYISILTLRKMRWLVVDRGHEDGNDNLLFLL